MKFVFDYAPVAQARPRVTPRPYIHVYDPAPVKRFKKLISAEAEKQLEELGQQYSDKAIAIITTFYRPVQKSLSRKETVRRLKEIVLPTVKPDLDNYEKSFFDSLNSIVWKDDCQLVFQQSRKVYSDNPRIEVVVYEINGGLSHE